MPDVRRCSIYGCRSNSREHKDLKFFNFPARESPFYVMWLTVCNESAEVISGQRRPYICSKHFHRKDIGFRRLATGAMPALFLTAPPGFAEEESARLAEVAAEHSEKIRLVNLVNETVLEWVRRAQNYADTADTCKTRRELRRIGYRVRNLLGATLSLAVDDYWLRKFRRSHISLLVKENPHRSRNKSLELESIIADIDPNATILSEDEIGFLLKEERARAIEMEQKRSLARAKKRATSDFSLVVGVHCKKYRANAKKNAAEESGTFADISSQSVESQKDESMSSGCYGIKSESNESLNLSLKEEGIENDDDEGQDQDEDPMSDDMDDSCNEVEPPAKNEIVINSYQQALEHLRPLEDFALKQENYRAIGLLSTLEIIFKNPNKDTDP